MHGYRTTRVVPIPERQLTAVQLVHLKTGAQHLHLACDDNNNTFAVGFPTNPTDSTGVAHILEHTALCGSRRYPVRDPFFNMLKRSLSTYMNAWTGSDFTMYPFSTTVAQDHSNLLSVYLDAAFFPLPPGLELSKPGAKTPLTIQGVVYNEMKGALSDAGSLFAQRAQQTLYPTTTYSNVSGGDPTFIKDLTHKDLVEFHRMHYHPSNARFFTYGSLPLAETLELINNQALSHFSRQPPCAPVPDETRWMNPRRVSIKGPFDPNAEPEKQTRFVMSWLANPLTDIFQTFSNSVLATLLLDSPNAPLHRALFVENTDLGQSFSPIIGFDHSAKECAFHVGVQGVGDAQLPRVESVVWDCLNKVAESGFSPQRIAVVMHQLELAQNQKTSNTGLSLAGQVVPAWCHDVDVIAQLQSDSLIERLKSSLAQDPQYFQKQIRSIFLNNSHLLVFSMHPDKEYSSKLEAAESKYLFEKHSLLSPEQLKQIEENSLKLKEAQDSVQNVSVLPTLRVSDISPKIPDAPTTTFTETRGVKIYHTTSATNNIVYVKVLLDLSGLTKSQRLLIPTFCTVLAEIGTQRFDFSELAQETDQYTGGISVTPLLTRSPLHIEPDTVGEFLLVSGSSLSRNAEKLVQLINDIITTAHTRFSDKYLLTLLQSRTESVVSSVVPSATRYALSRAASLLSEHGASRELLFGLQQVSYTRNLASKPLEVVAAGLSALSDTIPLRLLRIAVVSKNNELPISLRSSLDNLVASINSDSRSMIPANSVASHGMLADLAVHTEEGKVVSSKSYICIPAEAAYVAHCRPSFRYTHPDSTALLLGTRIATWCHLHKEIREKGGAYGASADLDNGLLSFTSHSDPQWNKSAAVLSDALHWIAEGRWTDTDLEQAKLMVISDLDTPQAPGQRGDALFMYGITADMRQTRRNRLLQATKDDVLQAVARTLAQYPDAASVALGPASHSGQAAQSGQQWTITELGS
eukprot:TRINITY_DN9502_c0_g1_i1.p1 TRINITY_DN9502_c0_g1~~TRINITY_DN9502_c0_g1_i1.p1  ORF type:complete len:993 (-),score=164.22 TRINITY_DN9502_c0_g1_i1:52-2976(-)